MNVKMKTRYSFRLDDVTEEALVELARITEQSKSFLMRKYVQEGIEREAKETAQRKNILKDNIVVMKSM